MEIAFFDYLGYTIAAFLITYISGNMVYACFGDGEASFEAEFKKLALGIWIIITGYSLFRTRLVSLSLGIFIPVLFWFWHTRPPLKFRWRFHGWGFLTGILLLVVAYTFLYFDLYDPVSEHFYYYYMDLQVYTTMVEKLNFTGIEGTRTDFLFKTPFRNLYHYGDLWYPACFIRLFGLNAMQTVYFLFPAVCMAVITMGALILARELSNSAKLDRMQVLISLSFLILSGFSFYVPRLGYFDARWGDQYNLLSQPKTYLVTVSAIWALLSLCRNDFRGFTLLLLSGMVMYPVTAPALLMAWGLLVTIKWMRGYINVKELIGYSLPIISFVIFVLFYMSLISWINKKYSASPVVDGISTLALTEWPFYKAILSTMLDTSVRVTISLAPFYLLCYVCRRDLLEAKSLVFVILFLIFGIYASAFAYALFHFHVDGFQLWTAPYATLVALFVFILLSRLKVNKLLKVAIVILCVYQNRYYFTDPAFFRKPYKYNHTFVHTVLSRIQTGQEGEIAIFRKQIKKETPVWGSEPNYYYPYDFLKFFLRSYNPYTISLLDTELHEDPLVRSFQLGYIYNSPFYRYVNRQKKTGQYVSVEQSQLDFIREFGVKYVFIEAGSTGNMGIDSMILETYSDTLAGYSFCVLR